MYPPYPEWHIELAQAVLDKFTENSDNLRFFKIEEYSGYPKKVGWIIIDADQKSVTKWDKLVSATRCYFARVRDGESGEDRCKRFLGEFMNEMRSPLPLQSIEAAAILSEWQTKYGNKVGV